MRRRHPICAVHHDPDPLDLGCLHCRVNAELEADKETKTMAAWNEEGRRICKGAKMAGRENGVPVFARRDTYVPVRRSSRDAGRDWDSDPGYSDLGIEAFQG